MEFCDFLGFGDFEGLEGIKSGIGSGLGLAGFVGEVFWHDGGIIKFI